MARPAKILLALTAACFVPGLLIFLGVIPVKARPGLHVLFPVGIILLGMLLLVRALERETAAFDAERQERERLLQAIPPQYQLEKRQSANAARAANTRAPEVEPKGLSSATR